MIVCIISENSPKIPLRYPVLLHTSPLLVIVVYWTVFSINVHYYVNPRNILEIMDIQNDVVLHIRPTKSLHKIIAVIVEAFLH